MVRKQRLPFQRVVGGVENMHLGDGRGDCGPRRNRGEKTAAKRAAAERAWRFMTEGSVHKQELIAVEQDAAECRETVLGGELAKSFPFGICRFAE